MVLVDLNLVRISCKNFNSLRIKSYFNFESYLVFTHLKIIISVFNRGLQKDGSKQYTDLDSPDFG